MLENERAYLVAIELVSQMDGTVLTLTALTPSTIPFQFDPPPE